MKKEYKVNNKTFIVEFYKEHDNEKSPIIVGYYNKLEENAKVTIFKIYLSHHPGTFGMLKLLSNLNDFSYIKNYSAQSSFDAEYKHFEKYTKELISFEF